ncbi:hypothetical protein GMSM_28870 [Geomonas sp. Red276]
MLALDSSIANIETSESEVLDLFQSQPLPLNLNGSRPEPRVAYICAVKKNTNVQIYVALAGERGRNLVYTDSDCSVSENDYQGSLQEALGFAQSMGFAPERVNLNYSPAMRAVVVRNYKIFNLPGSKPERVLTKSSPQAASAGSADTVQPLPSMAAAAEAAVAPSSARAAKPSPMPDLSREQANQVAIAEVLVKIGKELDAMRSERDDLLLRMQELSANHLGASAKVKTLQSENERLASRLGEVADAAGKLDTVSSELAAAREEASRLSRELDEVRQQQAALKAEHEAVQAEREALQAERGALQAEREALQAEREALQAENKGLKVDKAAFTEKLAVAEQESTRLAAERDALSQRTEELRQVVERTESELHETRAKVESVSGEMETERSRVQELEAKVQGLESLLQEVNEGAASRETEIETVRAELAAVIAERELLVEQEKESAGNKLEAARAKLKAVTAEKTASDQQVEKLEKKVASQKGELDSLRAEVASLSEERETLAKRENEQSAQLEALLARLDAVVVPSGKAVPEELAPLSIHEAKANDPAPPPIHEAAAAAIAESEPSLQPSVPADMAEVEFPPFDELELAARTGSEGEAVEAVADQIPEGESPVPHEAPAGHGTVEAAAVPAEAEPPKAAQPQPSPAQAEVKEPEQTMPERKAPDPQQDSIYSGWPETVATATFLAAPQASGFGFDSFPSFSDDDEEGPGLFLLQKEMHDIELGIPDNLVALYKSFNVTQVAPDGKGPERCEGYICCVKRDGGLKVYALIVGLQTGTIGIYAPEHQPADEQSLSGTISGASEFFEQVGLMMEPLDISSPERRTGQISGCPVLKVA